MGVGNTYTIHTYTHMCVDRKILWAQLATAAHPHFLPILYGPYLWPILYGPYLWPILWPILMAHTIWPILGGPWPYYMAHTAVYSQLCTLSSGNSNEKIFSHTFSPEFAHTYLNSFYVHTNTANYSTIHTCCVYTHIYIIHTYIHTYILR